MRLSHTGKPEQAESVQKYSGNHREHLPSHTHTHSVCICSDELLKHRMTKQGQRVLIIRWKIKKKREGEMKMEVEVKQVKHDRLKGMTLVYKSNVHKNRR